MLKIIENANNVALKYALYVKAGFYGDNDRCMEIAKRGYNKDMYIQYCLNKYRYLEKTFTELRTTASKEILRETHYPVLGCKFCGMGFFPPINDKKAINDLVEFEKKQRKKYNGEYVCKYCEEKNNKYDEYSKIYLLAEYGFGKHGMIIESGGVRNPKESFLGFAGRWFVITKNNEEIIITNNMWDKGSLPFIFKDKWMSYINCVVENFYTINDLKKILSKEQFIKLSTQNDFKKYCEYTNQKS